MGGVLEQFAKERRKKEETTVITARIPKGNYETFKDWVDELGLSLNESINFLIDKELKDMEIYKQREEEEQEEEEQEEEWEEEEQEDNDNFHHYKIYDEITKLPTDAEPIRSSFNMSKETTERLKKYASERRLPLQDLVELAVINLLDKYDRK